MTTPYAAIQPVNFFIPPDIRLGLDAGKLVRYGGVIRNQLGHIVTHLKEVPVPGKEPGGAQRLVPLLMDRRVLTVVVLGAAAGGVVTALTLRNQVQARRCAKNLNASLIAYLKSAGHGMLDEGVISRLLRDLDAVDAYSQNGQIAVAAELVDLVMDYTAKLAEANSVELEGVATASAGGAVVDLRDHLEVQRKIFADVA